MAFRSCIFKISPYRAFIAVYADFIFITSFPAQRVDLLKLTKLYNELRYL